MYVCMCAHMYVCMFVRFLVSFADRANVSVRRLRPLLLWLRHWFGATKSVQIKSNNSKYRHSLARNVRAHTYKHVHTYVYMCATYRTQRSKVRTQSHFEQNQYQCNWAVAVAVTFRFEQIQAEQQKCFHKIFSWTSQSVQVADNSDNIIL